MIELILVFAVVGLVVLWLFGIKPELEKRVNNEDVCKKHYQKEK